MSKRRCPVEQSQKRGSANHVENPPTFCPYGSRAQPHRAAPSAALQAGAVGFCRPRWFHPTPHLEGHSPTESLPRDQGEIAPHRALQGETTSVPLPAPSAHSCPCSSPHAPPAVWMEVWQPAGVWDEHGTVEPLQGSSCRDTRSPGPRLGALCDGCPGPSTALWLSQRILVSAYEKRRGGARGGDASKWPASLPHSRE